MKKEVGYLVAEIIGVGAALLQAGALENSTQTIARELETCGISARMGGAVGADASRLRTAIAHALSRSDVVILVGGLSINEDGIAKETVCEGLSRRMVLHEESLRRIRDAYEHAGRQMPQQAKRLAMMPEQSVVFPGVRAITPGCALSAGSQFIIIVPERPEEYLPMFQKSVLPYLARFSAAAAVTHTVNVFGLEEREVKAALGTILGGKNPSVSIFPKHGELQVRVTANASSKEDAQEHCAATVREVSKRLGKAAYGVDEQSLPEMVCAAIRQSRSPRRMTFSIGESGTGGLLTELLDNAGPILQFSVSAYATRVKLETLNVPEKLLKKQGSVSEAVAAAMAYGAQTRGKSTLGIGITGYTGMKGEDPRKIGLFYIAICDKDNVWVRKIQLPQDAQQDYLRYIACMHAFDLIRLYLSAPEGRLSGGVPIKQALTGRVEATAPSATTALVAVENKKGAAGNAGGKKPWYAGVIPVKGDEARDVIRKLILLIALVVFVGSISYIIHFYASSAGNAKKNEGFQTIYSDKVITDKEVDEMVQKGEYPKGYQKKFANLYKINPDVAGWIEIPGTKINYPVVQTDDNETYLRKDFEKKDSKYGIPWLDMHDSMNPQSDNYVIYGHNMTDGQMFGELMNYKPSVQGIEYLRQHPIISMDDVYQDNDYKIISVFITNVTKQYGEVFYYNTYQDMSDQAVFNEFVNEVKARSYYTSNIDVQHGDKFITLSTCSYEYGPVSQNAHVRTVIVGRRLRDGEKKDGSDITYAINPTPKMPTGFTKENTNAALAASKAAADAAASASAAAQASSQQASSQQAQPSQPEDLEQSQLESQVSSVPSESSEVQTIDPDDMNEEDYKAYLMGESTRKALEIAKNGVAQAKEAYRQADRAGDAAEARKYASKAQEIYLKVEEAYFTVQDNLYDLESLFEEYGSKTIQRYYNETIAAEETAKQHRKDAKRFAEDADSAARKLEEQSSASGVVSSSSAVSSSSVPEISSSTSVPEVSSSEVSPPPPSTEEEDQQQTPPETQTDGATTTPANTNDKLTVVVGGKKRTAQARKVVAGVVMNEMGTGFQQEALKAQAVAAYTYIKQQNKSGITPALGAKNPSSQIQNIVDEVIGEAVYYNDQLAFTPFFATSAGVTTSSKEVWGGSYPYLVSVDSQVDENARNYQVTVKMSEETVAKKVRSALGVDLYDYSSDPSDWFEIESYDNGGMYVASVRVGDTTTTGRKLREQVLGLRSAAFEISYSGGEFVFTTYGYGHGVGMSQTGANLYASEQGWDYQEILGHYYPGCTVQ